MIRYLPSCAHCGTEHVAYGDCDLCRARGHVLVDAGYTPCPACRSRYQQYCAALDAVDRELQRAKAARA